MHIKANWRCVEVYIHLSYIEDDDSATDIALATNGNNNFSKEVKKIQDSESGLCLNHLKMLLMITAHSVETPCELKSGKAFPSKSNATSKLAGAALSAAHHTF